jgi:hypothetical protein
LAFVFVFVSGGGLDATGKGVRAAVIYFFLILIVLKEVLPRRRRRGGLGFSFQHFSFLF